MQRKHKESKCVLRYCSLKSNSEPRAACALPVKHPAVKRNLWAGYDVMADLMTIN